MGIASSFVRQNSPSTTRGGDAILMEESHALLALRLTNMSHLGARVYISALITVRFVSVVRQPTIAVPLSFDWIVARQGAGCLLPTFFLVIKAISLFECLWNTYWI